MFGDKKARSSYVEAEWEKKLQPGQIQQFISLEWKGEKLRPAVIQGWNSRNWFQELPAGEGPQLLLSKQVKVDVVETAALGSIAGRIRIGGTGSQREVLLNISSGSTQLTADMC